MRAIDADALIAVHGNWYTEEGTETGYIGTVKGIVDGMPTIEPEPHWIPCSERLSEEGKEVLVSADGDIYIAEREVINGKEYWSEVIEYRYLGDVLAWMSLPAPYQPKEDES